MTLPTTTTPSCDLRPAFDGYTVTCPALTEFAWHVCGGRKTKVSKRQRPFYPKMKRMREKTLVEIRVVQPSSEYQST